MSTTALLASTPHVSDRYFFHTGLPNEHKASQTSPFLNKRYKFSSIKADTPRNPLYSFSNQPVEHRSHSSDSSRYYFPSTNSLAYSPVTLTYVHTVSATEPRSVKLIEETATVTFDTPYLFSKTPDTARRPVTTSTFVPGDGR